MKVGLALSPPPVSVSYIRNFLPTTPKPEIWALPPRSGKPAKRLKALSDFAELVKTSIAEKVDIIFSGAGLPLDLPSFLKKDSVTKLVPIVSSARAVRIICEKWKNNYDYLPDAVVLEGPKAGGHLGYKENQLEDEHFSLEELLPQVVEEVSHFEEKYNKRIPVIAAGGIIRVKTSNA